MRNVVNVAKSLDKMDKYKLGELYCKLNGLEWDRTVLGAPPKNFDKLSNRDKYHVIDPFFFEVKKRLTEEEQSMYWWKYELKRPYEEWVAWWYNQGGRNYILHRYVSLSDNVWNAYGPSVHVDKKSDLCGWLLQYKKPGFFKTHFKHGSFRNCDKLRVPVVYEIGNLDISENIIGHALIKFTSLGIYVYVYLNDTEQTKRVFKEHYSAKMPEGFTFYATNIERDENNFITNGDIKAVGLSDVAVSTTCIEHFSEKVLSNLQYCAAEQLERYKNG